MDGSTSNFGTVYDRPEAPVFRVRREIFSDPAIFEQELTMPLTAGEFLPRLKVCCPTRMISDFPTAALCG